jgi:hypothetical protein
VLDTGGVNAFASPGGIVHITRGALGLVESEAELAGVLAHEIGHVAHKHTVNAIKKNKAVQLGTSETLSNRGPFLDKLANKAYEMVLENKFDRGDEEEPKKGYGLGSLKPAASSERQTAQVSASGGSRGLGRDRNAKGGSNPAIVKASVTDAGVAAFKKGIA